MCVYVYIYISIDHTWRLVFPMFFAVFCLIVPYDSAKTKVFRLHLIIFERHKKKMFKMYGSQTNSPVASIHTL